MEKRQKYITNWEQLPIIFDLPMASLLVGIGEERLRQLSRAGKFPARKIGNSWRVDRESFKHWWEGQEERK